MDHQTLLTRLRSANNIYEKYRLKKVYLTGSYARNEASHMSDVDIYVPGVLFNDLSTYMNCKWDLESLTGKTVDLITDDNIQREIRPYILSDLVDVY